MASDNKEETSLSMLKILTKCPVEKLLKLLHSVCDRICGKRGASYTDFESIFTPEEWWEILQICDSIIKNLVKDEEYFKELRTGLSPDYEKVLKDCVLSRKEEIRQRLLNKSVANGSEAFLKDFDWNLKLVMGSDKMSDMREILASLQFQIQEGDEKTNFTLEMNKHELKDVIQALENASKVLTNL